MSKDIFVPFAEGTNEMLSMMLDLESSLDQSSNEFNGAFISGVIKLSGESMHGQIGMTFSKNTAIKMVGAMLEMPVEEVDDEAMQDGIGEMVNIAGGYAKSKLSDTPHKCDISLPTIVMGEGHHVSLFHGKKMSSGVVQTQLGTIGLTVWTEK